VPELPEVEVVRAGLAPAVTGARIAAVDVLDTRSLTRHDAASGDFEAILTGARIEAAVRRGKFLWLPIESPCPGTADVSANSCVLPTLAGETPGTSNARSRKFRPLSGRLLASVCVTVAATWLRTVSSSGGSAATVTVVSSDATASAIDTSNADPMVSDTVRFASANPSRWMMTSYGPTFR